MRSYREKVRTRLHLKFFQSDFGKDSKNVNTAE